MLSGFRQIRHVWKAERRVVCPWPASKTWYGRVGAAAAVVAGGAATVGAAAAGIVLAGKAGMAVLEVTLAGGSVVGSVLWSMTQRISTTRLATFNDPGWESWHDCLHGTTAMVVAAVAFYAGRKSRRIYRSHIQNAPNLCRQGLSSTFALAYVGASTICTLNAIDSMNAFCLKALYPADPRSARLKYHSSWLHHYTNPFLVWDEVWDCC
jgi:hypothetical protein